MTEWVNVGWVNVGWVNDGVGKCPEILSTNIWSPFNNLSDKTS